MNSKKSKKLCRISTHDRLDDLEEDLDQGLDVLPSPLNPGRTKMLSIQEGTEEEWERIPGVPSFADLPCESVASDDCKFTLF